MSHTEPFPPSGVPGPEEQPTTAMGAVPGDPASSWPPAQQPTTIMSSGAAFPSGRSGDPDGGATQFMPLQAATPPSGTSTGPVTSRQTAYQPGQSTQFGTAATQQYGYAAPQPAAPRQPPAAAPRQQYVPTQQAPAPSPVQPRPPQQQVPAFAPAQPGTGPQGAGPNAPGTPTERTRSRSDDPSRGGGDQRKDKLGAGWISFIVVDALLVITAVVMAVTMFGSDGSDGDPEAQPTTTVQEPVAVGPDTTVQEAFKSPTGNITCEMSEASATCVIKETKPPADVQCGASDWYRVALDANGVTTTCVTSAEQAGVTTSTASVPSFEYTEPAKQVGEFSCVSSDLDMSCDGGGAGFSINKAGIRTR